MKKKEKLALLLAASATLSILSGCENSENTIIIDDKEYVRNVDEYVEITPSPTFTPRPTMVSNDDITSIFNPGEHLITETYYFKVYSKGYIYNGYNPPEGYELFDVASIVEEGAFGGTKTTGIMYFYINKEVVEATGKYNYITKKYEFIEPGVVVKEKTLEMEE